MNSSLEAFATEARAFAHWALGQSTRPTAENALVRLVALYRAALSLPQPWTEGMSSDVAEVQLPQSDLDAVLETLSQLPVRFYWEVYDPFEEPKESPVAGDVADDIGDIYRDVARGLVLFDSAQHDEALWEWGFNFRIHWGRHATSAIRALHSYLADENPDGLSNNA